MRQELKTHSLVVVLLLIVQEGAMGGDTIHVLFFEKAKNSIGILL